MYHVPLDLQCIYGRSDEEGKLEIASRVVRFWEEGRKWRLTRLLYADDLVLCDESEEDLRVMVGRFVEVRRRKGLKVNEVRTR